MKRFAGLILAASFDETYFYLLCAIVLAVFIAGYFASPEGTVGKGISFALIIFLTSTFLGTLTLVLVNDFFGIVVAIGTVGAFLGYAIMRNSGKNGKSGDEKDKK
ncbi:MAG: hypothetical protein LUD44_08545 [Firmicutes bacterium]|nr:hypothetical protein [Bacillota bacterium]